MNGKENFLMISYGGFVEIIFDFQEKQDLVDKVGYFIRKRIPIDSKQITPMSWLRSYNPDYNYIETELVYWEMAKEVWNFCDQLDQEIPEVGYKVRFSGTDVSKGDIKKYTRFSKPGESIYHRKGRYNPAKKEMHLTTIMPVMPPMC